MTGLNLETFLHLLRADWAAWLSLGGVCVLLAVMTWTSWGSRRALRKCLVLSVFLHLGLVLYGSSSPYLMASSPGEDDASGGLPTGIRQIRVSPTTEATEAGAVASRDGRPGR